MFLAFAFPFFFLRYSCTQHHLFGAGWLLSTLITSYPIFLSVEEPRFVILRFDPINCPDSYGGGSIPAHAMSAFALCSLLTSPISAISLTARTSPTPPISLTVEYSGRDFASTCIRVTIRDRELSTVLNTDMASCTNILVDGVLEGSVGMPLEANS